MLPQIGWAEKKDFCGLLGAMNAFAISNEWAW
jgi:hypothetical protein